LVEKYLASRGLDLPEHADRVLRFHPSCPFGAEHHPAMIALVRCIAGDKPQGVQRTALTPDGLAVKRPDKSGKIKTLRMSLGSLAGGAVKFDDDADVAAALTIGEGTETCLTARQWYDLAPVWSAVNLLAKFPILPFVDSLTLLQENDANGTSARDVEECAARWHAGGRLVRICEPEPGFCDLNDELRKEVRR
jgi:hypothetical protein